MIPDRLLSPILRVEKRPRALNPPEEGLLNAPAVGWKFVEIFP